MPYIGVKTTKEISAKEEATLKAELGKAVETFPGKSEAWLMTEFSGGCRLWMRGDNSEDSAFVEVKIFGKIEHRSCDAMTGKLCGILSSCPGISPDRIYVTYSGYSEWGWNGGNF